MSSSTAFDDLFKLVASCFSSAVVNASISLRSPASLSCNCAVKLARAGPVTLKNTPLQSEPRLRLRIGGCDVILALARHGEAHPLEGAHDPVAVLDLPRGDALFEEGRDRLPGLRPLLALEAPLERAGALGVVRPRPTLLVVPGVPERRVGALPAGRCDVQRLAGRQLHARRQEVQLDAAAIRVAVAHPGDVVLLRVHPGEGHALEVVYHRPLVVRAWRVLAGEADDPGSVGPLAVDAVDQFSGALDVAAHDLRRSLLAARAAPVDQVGGNRAAPAAAAHELDQHGASDPCSLGME
nr:hypothetical protein [uncultured Jannaschia sp.]